jgi:hypothetical protein
MLLLPIPFLISINIVSEAKNLPIRYQIPRQACLFTLKTSEVKPLTLQVMARVMPAFNNA